MKKIDLMYNINLILYKKTKILKKVELKKLFKIL